MIEVIELDPTDGVKDDFVWKPESDTKKNKQGEVIPVVLFPRKGPGKKQSWADPFRFKRVEILYNGERIARGKFVYHWKEDKKPRRQVWRFEIPAKKLPRNIYVVADGKYSWLIKNPYKRVD